MEVFHPRLDPTGIQFRHHGKTLDNHYLSTAEEGHPHYALYPEYNNRLGLSFRPDLFPTFSKNPDNITFYQVQRPFTLLSYHSSLNRDYQVHVTHSQNINERWNFALDYHLFSPQGVYANSSAVDHLLDFNTNYYSPDARYQLRAGVIWQRLSLGENGGLSNDSDFVFRRIANPAGHPVVSTDGNSRYTQTTLFINQSFNTVRQIPWYRDRVVTEKDTTRDSTYNTHLTTITDTLYPSDPRVFNTGVLGLNLQFDRHKYRITSIPSTTPILGTITDSTLNHIFSGSLFWTNDAYLDHQWHNPFKVTLGIRTYLSKLDLDTARFNTPQTTTLLAYPFAMLTITPWQSSEFSVLAETEPKHGEYNLDFNLLSQFPTVKSQLDIRATLQAHGESEMTCAILGNLPQPVDRSQLLIRSNRIEVIYRNTRLQQSTDSKPLKADYRLSLSATAISNHHYLYKDSTAIVPCFDHNTDIIPLFQARANIQLQLWQWLHYDMQQLFQYSTQDIIHVPLWASKNSIYADFHLFRHALRTQVGFDIRYHTAFKADSYDPSLGLFYWQNDVTVGNYIYADFFINLQIKRASIYVKAGHINSIIESESHYFSLPHYPENPFGLLYGLTWQFFD